METSTDLPTTSPPTTELEFHPDPAPFPLLPIDGPEFAELVADIGVHGLLQPIVLHEGRILDGRNHYRACQHAGVKPHGEVERGFQAGPSKREAHGRAAGVVHQAEAAANDQSDAPQKSGSHSPAKPQ